MPSAVGGGRGVDERGGPRNGGRPPTGAGRAGSGAATGLALTVGATAGREGAAGSGDDGRTATDTAGRTMGVGLTGDGVAGAPAGLRITCT
jgi:hypothetical protein